MRTLADHFDSVGYVARLATAYDKADDSAPASEGENADEAPAETFEIPEDFSELGDEELTELHTQAVGHFDSIYGDGSGLSDEDFESLASLTEGIEALAGEVNAREAKATERAEKAAELASRVKPEDALNSDSEDGAGGGDSDEDEGEDGDAEDSDSDDEDEDDSDQEDESAAETVTASGKRKPTRINLSNIRNRGKAPATQNFSKAQGMKQVAFAADGEGSDWDGISKGLDRKLASFNAKQYEMASRRGQHLREQNSVAVFHKPVPESLVASSADPEHVEAVMSAAVDQSRLKGGSLVAAGGWGAPSETLYDFLELESRDGLVSVPEIGVARGGIHFTQGIDFRDIFNNTGFSFTETDDEAGNYDGEGGDKPHFHVEMPDFDEARLDVDGVYITAGLLASRGYPEVIQRVLRGALVAHDHKMSANVVGAIEDDSDEVVMPDGAVGAVAPILNAIDLQVSHYRSAHRLPMGATLEAIFPFWVHGAVKADLARRDGLDYLQVSDAQITQWFTQRGIAPQFIYNWQEIGNDSAASFTAWPTEVSFLLYAAGTWIKGASDIITLDTVYDSLTLGQNNYTALFTEEGWLVAKRGVDSRLVTVNISASGSTGAPQLLDHDGTAIEVSGA